MLKFIRFYAWDSSSSVTAALVSKTLLKGSSSSINDDLFVVVGTGDEDVGEL